MLARPSRCRSAVPARLICLAALLITFAGAVHGTPPLTCVAHSPAPTVMRAEGAAELAGDIVIVCFGGVPNVAGTLLPQVNLTVFLNQAVTSRVFSAGGWSEALLLIDEPNSGLAGSPTQLRLCAEANGICPIYATGTESGDYDGTAARPNVFQGVVTGNRITFPGIPFDAPFDGRVRVLRITNIRANAAAMIANTDEPVPLMALISASGAVSMPITNPTQFVGLVRNSLATSVLTPDGSGPGSGWRFNQCSPGRQRVGALAFSARDPFAFRKRSYAPFVDANTSPAPQVQNVPGLIYKTETGFYDPALTGPNAGFPALGLADAGTRLRAVIRNIPPGSTVHVSATGVAFTGGVPAAVTTGTVARLIQDESLPFAATPATATLDDIPAAELQVVNGTATAVWEVLSADPAATETHHFLVWVQPGDAAPATATVAQSYAPFTAGFIPQFADTSSAATLFLTSDCAVRLTTPAALPDGLIGTSYGATLAASMGAAPYTFAVTSGSLPSGVSLSGGGAISGAPQVTGDFNFTVTVTDRFGGSEAQAFSLHVRYREQSIDFRELVDRRFGEPPIYVAATATSGLPVTFSIASGPATILGNRITLTGEGTVTVTASQPGDAIYSAAPPVSRSFRVLPTTYYVVMRGNPLWAGNVTATPDAGGLYTYGATPQFTAQPNPGYVFTGFSGGLTGTANPQMLLVTQNTSVVASFAPIPADGGDSVAFWAVSGTSSPARRTVALATPGAGASVSVTPGTGGAWLSAALNPADLPTEVLLTLNAAAVSELGSGAYTSYAIVTTAAGQRVITATLTVNTVSISRVVDAAGYQATPLAPGALFTAFGSNLAKQAVVAELPLPAGLGGSSVTITDSAGAARTAVLLYVSPTQINFVTPSGLTAGEGSFTITNSAGVSRTIAVRIGGMSPGLFSADGTGSGAAAAVVTMLRADGTISITTAATYDAATGQCPAAPIDLGDASDQVYLTLYGTGIRDRSSLAQVVVRVGGVQLAAEYAGAQPQYAGLDQINVKLPRSLAGIGETPVTVTVDGRRSNAVTVKVQ
jgi:uncharacterized protein (TIGR03437 family)